MSDQLPDINNGEGAQGANPETAMPMQGSASG